MPASLLTTRRGAWACRGYVRRWRREFERARDAIEGGAADLLWATREPLVHIALAATLPAWRLAQFISSCSRAWGWSLVKAAASFGRIDVLAPLILAPEWFDRAFGDVFDGELFREIAARGRVDVLKMMWGDEYEHTAWRYGLWVELVRGGHLEALKVAVATPGTVFDREIALNVAIMNGRADIVNWLRDAHGFTEGTLSARLSTMALSGSIPTLRALEADPAHGGWVRATINAQHFEMVSRYIGNAPLCTFRYTMRGYVPMAAVLGQMWPKDRESAPFADTSPEVARWLRYEGARAACASRPSETKEGLNVRARRV